MNPADEHRVSGAIEELLRRHPDPSTADASEFQLDRYQLGLAWVRFAAGFGGLGVGPEWQGVVDSQLAELGAPAPGSGDYVGMHQVAAALDAFGTDEQKQRYLPAIFTGSEVWCQLFSEPGAGSDLAGVATMARSDGEEWVVTGQKVWTSLADKARWGLLLARSDPDAPKHRGLTCFVCDMTRPGIEVRPLRQADGSAHFNEVFLDGVVLEDALRLGPRAGGWGVAIAALHAERGGIGATLAAPLGEVLRAWEQFDATSISRRRHMRRRVARTWIEVRCLDLLKARLAGGNSSAGPSGSLIKLAQGGINQRAAGLLVELMGPAGQIGFDYASYADDDTYTPPAQMLAVRSRAHTIEGGSDEIQRNIVAERLLGLPGDIRVDKHVAWTAIRRS